MNRYDTPLPPGDQNVERLIEQAYHPEPVDPEFRERIMTRLDTLAEEIADRKRPIQKPRFLQQRTSIMAGALAAMLILALTMHFLLRDPNATNHPDSNDDSTFAMKTQMRPRPQLPEVERANPGAVVTTKAGQRRYVRLPDGSNLLLNEMTQVRITADRKVKVETGEIFVEVSPRNSAQSGATFTVQTPERTLQALGTKFSVKVNAQGTGALVTQGKVKVDGLTKTIEAGEQVQPGSKDVTAAPRASHILAWARELLDSADVALVPLSSYTGGALVTKDETGKEQKLELRKYMIDVHIEDGFARTTIDQTYFNGHPRRMEGTFYFPLPEDASLSRLVMYVGGERMEGGMVEKNRGRAIYQQIVDSQKDPALLEWVDGSTFRMRVFPLEARHEKRIVLSYTQRLAPLYGRTTYRFPAGHSLGEVADWKLNVRVKNGSDWKLESPMKNLQRKQDVTDLLIISQEKKFRFDHDVILNFTDESVTKRDKPRFSMTKHLGDYYLMLRYRPELPKRKQVKRRDWVILFESTAERNDLIARTQAEVLRAFLSQIEHDDTFTILTVNHRVHAVTPKPLPGKPKEIALAMDKLEKTHLIGALDLGNAFDVASTHLNQLKNPYLLHIGAGHPRLGERRTHHLVNRLPKGTQYVGIGVGKSYARNLMKAAAEKTGGYFTQINPDESIAWRTFELYSTLNTPRLVGLKVAEDSHFFEFLNHDSIIAQGEEVCVIARKSTPPEGWPKSITLTGQVDGQEFKKEIAIDNPADNADYLPRTWARLEIERLLRANPIGNKNRIIALSKAMYVMTPFTSLLVLENEKMYQQFKVDRGRKDHWALYNCPKTIPVVHEPLPGAKQPEKKPEDHREKRKPNIATVHQSILIRGLPYFKDRNTGVVPLSTVTFAPYEDRLAIAVLSNQQVEKQKKKLLNDLDGVVRRFDSETYNTNQLSGGKVLRLFERGGQIYDPQSIISTEGLSGITWSTKVPEIVTDRTARIDGKLGQFGNSARGIRERLSIVNGTLARPGWQGQTGNDLGFYYDFAPNDRWGVSTIPANRAKSSNAPIILSPRGRTQPLAQANFEPLPFEREARLWLMFNLMQDAQRAPLALTTAPYRSLPDLLARPGSVLYRRPVLVGGTNLVRDLLIHAPGLNSTWIDIQTVLEKEAQLPEWLVRGRVEDRAKRLIENARRQQWQSVTIPANGMQESFTLTHDHQGRYRYDRRLTSQLREIVICDGNHLWHLYPEIGLGSKREVGRFHHAELTQLIPWYVPSLDDLALAADVLSPNDNTVSIVPHSGGVELRLIFNNGQLSERQLIARKDNKVVLRQTIDSDGTVKLFDLEKKERQQTELVQQSTKAANLKPTTEEMVILPMPIRSRANVLQKHKLKGSILYPQLSEEQAMDLLSALTAQHNEELPRLLTQRFLARGDRRPGLLVLLIANGHTLETVGLGSNDPSDPLQKYLHQFRSLKEAKEKQQTAKRERLPEFFEQMNAFHELVKLSSSLSRTRLSTDEEARLLKQIEACRSPLLLWTIVQRFALQEKQTDKHTHGGLRFREQVLRMASDSLRSVPALGFAARYELGCFLFVHDKKDEARKLFTEVFTKVFKDGDLPAVDAYFREALETNSGDNAWSTLMRDFGKQLIEQHRYTELITLSEQCSVLGELELSDELLASASFKSDPVKHRNQLLHVAHSLAHYHRYEAAERVIRDMLKNEKLATDSQLWRKVSELAQKQKQTHRAMKALEQALELEWKNPPAKIDLKQWQHDHETLLGHYHTLTMSASQLQKSPPAGLAERLIRLTERWRSRDMKPDSLQMVSQCLRLLDKPKIAWDYDTTRLGTAEATVNHWSTEASNLARQRLFEEADRAWQEAFALDPTNPSLIWKRVENWQKAGQPSKAKPALQQIVDGEWSSSYRTLQNRARRLLGRK